MWPFKSDYTGVKILIKNRMHSLVVKKVYDIGSGPYIKTYIKEAPRYLSRDGDFQVSIGSFDCVNGDAVSWRQHQGDVNELNWDLTEKLNKNPLTSYILR